MVLKRLSDALHDGDRIIALVKGSAVNQDGRSNGLTAPHGPSQQDVIRQALENAGVTPAQIGYVEAHGTGTALGDPIEVNSLWEVLKEDRSPHNPCAIGSVKTNIGHLEAAAGIAGLIKTALCLYHRKLTPHLHLQKVNPLIPLDEMGLIIPTSLQPWSANGGRFAGVSSFGFGGTNAHVVLGESAAKPSEIAAGPERPTHILSLSAHSERGLRELCGRYADHLDSNRELPPQDVCFTANTGRAHFGERITTIGSTTAELSARLRTASAGPVRTDGRVRTTQSRKRPKIALLYTGQGSQYPGMGRDLYESQPTFRRILDACDEILRGQLEQPLLSALYPAAGQPSLLHETEYTQPALFALECAITELWRSWGIEADAVLGHSVGAYAAAKAAGIFDLEAGLLLIARRARLMQTLSGDGRMAAVFTDETRVAAAIAPYRRQVAIAAINGSRHFVISGEPAAIRTVLESLEKDGVFTQPLESCRAFHSPLMEPLLDSFERAAREVDFAIPGIPFISDSMGVRLEAGVIPDASYWRNHLRDTVQFSKAIDSLMAEGCNVLLEVGPTPSLLGMGKRCLPKDTQGVDWLASMKPGRPDWEQMLESLGALYVGGADVDWSGFDRDYPRHRVSLPTYPFERKRYWIASHDAEPHVKPVSGEGEHRHDGDHLPAASKRKEFDAMNIETTVQPSGIPVVTALKPARKDAVLETLRAIVANLLELDLAEIDVQARLLDMGADSLILLEAVRTIERTYGIHLTMRQMFEDLTTLDALAAHIDRTLPLEVTSAPHPTSGGAVAQSAPGAAATVAPVDQAASRNGGPPPANGALERIMTQQLELLSQVLLQQVAVLRETAPPERRPKAPRSKLPPTTPFRMSPRGPRDRAAIERQEMRQATGPESRTTKRSLNQSRSLLISRSSLDHSRTGIRSRGPMSSH